MSIYAISDLHADFVPNRTLIEKVSARKYQADTLIIAGDIAGSIEVLGDVLASLRSKFKQVCFMVGNHELWVHGKQHSSVEKLSLILALCKRLDVQTGVTRADGACIVPLFSWYEKEFGNGNGAVQGDLRGWNDYHMCKWPAEIANLAEYFFELNKTRIRTYHGPVITFSHFLPRPEFLPTRAKLKFRGLPLVAGSRRLEAQLRALTPVAHIFGHSHINSDEVVDGIRYVQNALKYPRERQAEQLHLKKVW